MCHFLLRIQRILTPDFPKFTLLKGKEKRENEEANIKGPLCHFQSSKVNCGLNFKVLNSTTVVTCLKYQIISTKAFGKPFHLSSSLRISSNRSLASKEVYRKVLFAFLKHNIVNYDTIPFCLLSHFCVCFRCFLVCSTLPVYLFAP